MPRRVIIVLLFLTLVLAACKSTSQTGTATIGASATPEVTAVPQQPATLQVPGQAVKVPGCTVVSFLPTPDPTSLFPPVSAEDWTNGPLTATVTIIEYSDFQ